MNIVTRYAVNVHTAHHVGVQSQNEDIMLQPLPYQNVPTGHVERVTTNGVIPRNWKRPIMLIVDGYYVMCWLGGRYRSVAWYKEQLDANKECQRLLNTGYWSGMPPTIHPSFKEYCP